MQAKLKSLKHILVVTCARIIEKEKLKLGSCENGSLGANILDFFKFFGTEPLGPSKTAEEEFVSSRVTRERERESCGPEKD